MDSTIAKLRAGAGKDISDDQWENYVENRFGMTAAEFRDFLSRQLTASAVQTDIQSKIKVSDDEARNQFAKVNLIVVTVPSYTGTPPKPTPKGPQPLPDAEARKKADDLLAKVRAGGDIAAIAKANSNGLFTGKGGETGLQPEYPQQGQMSLLDALYGKDFLDAVHKTNVGQLTDVIPLTGFTKGYAFAKVVNRSTDLPKDFNLKQAVDQLKAQKATQEEQTLLASLNKNAKIEITDPDKRVFYDYFKSQSPGMLNGGSMPNPAETAQLKTQADQELDDYLKRHPDDETVAWIAADNLGAKQFTTPGQTDAIRARRIALYTTVLNRTESRDVRFTLADLYVQNKQNDLALQQYDKIKRFLDDAPPYDLTTMQDAKTAYQQLQAGYNKIGQTAQADAAAAKVKDLTVQIAAEQKKQAQQAPPAGAALPGGGAAPLPTPPPAGGAQPATAPAASGAKPAVTPVPSGTGATGTASPSGSTAAPVKTTPTAPAPVTPGTPANGAANTPSKPGAPVAPAPGKPGQ